MLFSVRQLNKLSDIALKAATTAGHYIKTVEHSLLKTSYKKCGSSLSSQVVTDVDLNCQEMIIKQLQPSCDKYDIALLSEENCTDFIIDQHPRLSKEYFWCIDPLDGTLPFLEGGEGYAVSIALVNQQGAPLLAAVYLPATDNCYQIRFDARRAPILYKNNIVFTPKACTKKLHLYCDRSFLNSSQYSILCKKLKAVAAMLKLKELKVISGNGAVVNAILVLENSSACYIKLPKKEMGGGALWDFSATACIHQSTGAWVTDIHGLPLTLNQADSYYMNKNGVLFASNTLLGKTILKAVEEIINDNLL